MYINHPLKFIKINSHAYTFAEVMAVFVVMGVLAAISIPKFVTQMERIKSQEGAQVLSAVYLAQQSYKKDTGNYATSFSALDVEIPSATNFDLGTLISYGLVTNTNPCSASDASCCAPGAAWMAKIDNKAHTYTLIAAEDGTIGCLSCGSSSVCPQLGYHVMSQ